MKDIDGNATELSKYVWELKRKQQSSNNNMKKLREKLEK